MKLPTEGGRYTRDAKTGKLTKGDPAPDKAATKTTTAKTTTPAEDTASKAKES
ncbi:hypothetical protein [Acidimangrovimonas sediminis]|uniref:hypothetical protein n=1 Tax=Acidimangrovimonas sediminis TaxID=2056283 RepID=UPI001304BC47|nr:hypothetical protein [Acidimangrovimonas sediminis]